MWTVLKVFIEFVTILLLFYGRLRVFGCKAYENLALPTRDQTFALRIRRPSAPTGQPGQSLPSHSWCLFLFSLRMMKPVSFTESDDEGHVGIVARVRFLALGKTTAVYSSLLGLGFFMCAMVTASNCTSLPCEMKAVSKWSNNYSILKLKWILEIIYFNLIDSIFWHKIFSKLNTKFPICTFASRPACTNCLKYFRLKNIGGLNRF